jgi:hypothetical protein
MQAGQAIYLCDFEPGANGKELDLIGRLVNEEKLSFEEVNELPTIFKGNMLKKR